MTLGATLVERLAQDQALAELMERVLLDELRARVAEGGPR